MNPEHPARRRWRYRVNLQEIAPHFGFRTVKKLRCDLFLRIEIKR